MKRLATFLNHRSFPVIFVILVLAVGCDSKKADGPGPEPVIAAAPVGFTGMILAIEGEPTGVELETAGVKATLSGVQWSFGPGSSLATDSTTRAALVIGDGGSLILERDSRVRFPSDKERTISIEQGRAVITFPHREEATTPSAHVVVPTGELLLLGTKVSVDALAEESTVTVSQGIIEARGGDEVIRAYPGDQIVLPRGAGPRVLATPDLAESFGWSELAEDEEGILADVPRGIGKLVGKVPGGYTELALEKHNQKVTVRIQGNVAYTEIHETFHNPTGQTLEGLYRFPLPSDAQISRLSLKVGNKWMEGEFLETERAARIWRDVIERWRDPAWLRWQEGNQFELRIFPIEPRTSREVIIGYTQRLTTSGEGYRYVYPMPVDKGGMVASKAFEFEGTIVGMEAGQGISTAGYDAAVEFGANDQDRAFGRVKFAARDFVPAGDFSIRFGRRELVDTPQIYAYQQTAREGGEGYALMTVRPTLPRTDNGEARDFVVVVDSSYSQQGAAFDLTRRVTSRMIREMDPRDRVLVVACNERCVPVGSPSFEHPDGQVETTITEELATVSPRGSNHAVEALRVAARLLDGRDGELRDRRGHVIYFTDGIASAGASSPHELAEAASRMLRPTSERLTLVDVGGNADLANLQAMARGGRGTIVSLRPGETMASQALQILNRHYGPLLTEVALDLPAGLELVHPTQFEALVSGQEIVVAARVRRPVSGTLQLRGRIGDEYFERQYPVEIRPETIAANGFVPRQWAQQRIRDLELEDGALHRREIIELSTKFGVLSRFTSLLAMESEEMMREYGLRRQDRTDWRGEEMPEAEMDALAAAGPGEPMAAPMAQQEAVPRDEGFASGRAGVSSEATRSASPPPAAARRPAQEPQRKSAPSSSGGADLDLWGPEPSERRARPQPTPPPAMRRPVQPPRGQWVQIPASTTIRTARDTTDAERRRVERFAQQLERDENNRTTRLSYIRSILRTADVARATREVDEWLEMNPVDAEAIVQKAQILSYEGRVDEALGLLASAVDVAPRGEWIQERIQAAYEARGERALACAHGHSRLSIDSKKRVDDPLSCPMATRLSQWGLPDDSDALERLAGQTTLRGNLVITLTSDSDAELDLLIIEPDGRILSWLSQRRRVQVAGVPGARKEQISIPSLYAGTFKVRVVRADDGRQPANAKVEIQGLRRNQSFDVVLRGQGGQTVAEVVYEAGRTEWQGAR